MKTKLKKIVPYILIVLAVILLGIVISVVLQFTFKGEVISMEEPEPPISEQKYTLVNESKMDEQDITDLVVNMRDDMVNYLNPIRYYTITDIEPSYSEEDNEKYMVLTDDFTDNLKFLVTTNLYNKLINNFEILKTENNKVYYKVSKDEFNPLFNNSALNIFDYTNMEIHPIYANEDKIESIVKYKYCDKENSDLCRRDDDYNFNLVKENDTWLVDNIGYKFNE